MLRIEPTFIAHNETIDVCRYREMSLHIPTDEESSEDEDEEELDDDEEEEDSFKHKRRK